MTNLPSRTYLRSIAADVERFADLLESLDAAGWGSAVPSCPGWNVAELTRHVGGVHRMVLAAVRTGKGSHSSRYAFSGPDGADCITWLREGARELIEVLDADPRELAWSFDPADHNIGFWQRRQAMENAIHRVDVELALGARTSVAADIAADGVAEVLDTMVRLGESEGSLALSPDAGAVLRAVDVDRIWQLGTARQDRSDSVTATAEEVFLLLWKRRALDARACTGDVAAIRELLALPLTP